MSSKLKSREEQLATMRALLHGETQPKKRIAQRRSPRGHPKGRGLELSDLEQRALDTLHIVTDDRLIRRPDGPKFYILPDSILDLDEETSFTQDDLRHEAKNMIPHLLAQPRNQIVDIFTVDGTYVDTEEHA
ncbi:uncharacterized protein Aud_002333 [Aspergillus udagawae]|uniref:Uncharacterized protein n=1 Tax=Aspergillus udagawae TaxID=91492 RepID=A0A8E0QJL4_9EURO|nr:uncharacterized protein Aud_002333 [Aspergillus udagawae]GIC85974.1 hypothetical protein Aud_002333 [Aspergillus udagawae]